MTARRRAGLLVLLAALLAYGQVLGGGFQYDDFNVIVDAPRVHSLAAWTTDLGGLRPLLKLSYALNWSLDPGPAGFLAVNLGLHLACVGMVLALLAAVGRRAGLEPGPARFAAVAGALLFALHPVQTEAVAYVSGRSSSLAAALSLASALAYLHGRERRRRVWTWGISPCLFLLAALTKETALVLPLALALLERCGPAAERRPVRGPAVHWGLLAGAVLGLALHPGYRGFLAHSFGLQDAGARLRGSLEGLTYLASKLLWPAGLNIDPPLQVPAGWTLSLGAAAALLLALAAAGAWAVRRRPAAGFGLLWGLLMLLPTQGPVPRLDLANERHLYLPVAGFAYLAGLALARMPERVRCAATALLAVALGCGTFLRVRDYRDEVALWTASLRVAPHNPRAWNNLGVAQFQRGDRAAAAAAFQEALRLRPGYALARENLGGLVGGD